MLSVCCPQCGKPAPISLAAPSSLGCDACGYAGAPEAEDAERIRAAASAVQAMQASELELSGIGRRALESGFFRLLLYLALAGGLLLPVGCLTGVLVSWSSPLLAVFISIPMVTMLIVFVVGWTALRHGLRQLEDACAATPPRSEGEPARCYVCGGPLTDGAAIVHCSFCQADNVVSRQALTRSREHHDRATADLAGRVGGRAKAVRSLTRRILFALVGSLFVGPVLMIVSMVLLVVAVDGVELDLDASQRIAFVDVGGERCVGELLEGDRMWFGGREEDGYLPSIENVDPDDYEWIGPSSLVGRRVRARPSGLAGEVGRVFGVVDGHNAAMIRGDHGEEESLPLASLCLVE